MKKSKKTKFTIESNVPIPMTRVSTQEFMDLFNSMTEGQSVVLPRKIKDRFSKVVRDRFGSHCIMCRAIDDTKESYRCWRVSSVPVV